MGSNDSPSRLSSLRRYLPAALTFCAGVALSVAGFAVARNWEQERTEVEFRRRAQNRATILQAAFDEHLHMLCSIGDFYAAEEREAADRTISRQDFRRFVQRALSRHREIQALAWVPRVSDSERTSYEAAAQADGFAKFQISERDSQGRFVRAGRRKEYFPAYYVEPYGGNQTLLGFDFASNPAYREAMNRARDTSAPIAAAWTALQQENGRHSGCLVFLPLYRAGAPHDSPEERRENLSGFALATVRIGDTVEESLAHFDVGGVDLYLYDATAGAGERFLYFRPSYASRTAVHAMDEADVRAALHWAAFLDMAGRRWTLLCHATPEYLASQRTWHAGGILAGGLLFTILLGAYLTIALGRTAQVERLVAKRTAELSEANAELEGEITERKQAEEALRESEGRYRHLFERLNDAVLVADPETGRLLEANAAAERLTGYSREELVGMHQSQFHPAGQAEAYRERFQRHIAEGTAADFDAEIVRKDGTVAPVYISAAVCEIAGQQVLQGIFRDISERKRAEDALRASEERYRSLVKHLPQRIFVKDRNSVYVSCNANYARDLGIEPEWIVGKDDFDFHPRELADMYRADDQAVIGSGTPKDIEEKYLVSGEERWVHTVKLPYRDEQGHVVGLLGIFEDITERKQADERLRQAWEVTNTILESLPIGVIVIGRDKTIRRLNAAALRMMGLDSAEEVLGQTCNSRMCPADEGKCPVLDLGQTVDNSEHEMIDRDGRRIPILKSVLPITLEGEDVLLEAFVDITESKRMEAQLRKHQKSLEASNTRLAEMTQEMQQFLYLVSHDLRSPLVTIEGFASRLLTRHAEQCGEEGRHSLERIRAGVQSMARLIEALLHLSRTNTAELTPISLDMDEVVAEVVRDLGQQASDAGARIEIQSDLPPAWGDQRAVYQVLLNLVSNAVKYHGDTEPLVWIGGHECDEGVEFTVRDNGVGIEADKLDSVFQMFTRADSLGCPGLGIGLTGAKRLVERHGGRIWAESLPGQGSTFHFTLPHQEVSDGQAMLAARDPAGRGRSRPCRTNA